MAVPRYFIELEKKIRKYQSQDISSIPFDEIVEQIMSLTDGMELKTVRINEGERLYRARIINHAEKVSEVSYPTENVGAGRANREGSPKFYASFNLNAAIAEVGAKPGDVVVVSSWNVSNPLDFSHVGFHPRIFKSIGASRKHIRKLRSSAFYKANPHMNHLSIMANAFIGNKSTYKLSAAIAECMLRGPFHGLIYPSIALGGQADNFAVNPWCIGSDIKFAWAEKVRVKTINNRQLTKDHVDFAKSENGMDLNWRGRPSSFFVGNKEIKFGLFKDKKTKDLVMYPLEGDLSLVGRRENGAWILRGKDGKIVDPM